MRDRSPRHPTAPPDPPPTRDTKPPPSNPARPQREAPQLHRPPVLSPRAPERPAPPDGGEVAAALNEHLDALDAYQAILDLAHDLNNRAIVTAARAAIDAYEDGLSQLARQYAWHVARHHGLDALAAMILATPAAAAHATSPARPWPADVQDALALLAQVAPLRRTAPGLLG